MKFYELKDISRDSVGINVENHQFFDVVIASTVAMVPIFVACGVLELITSLTYLSSFAKLCNWLASIEAIITKLLSVIMNVILSINMANRARIPVTHLLVINIFVLAMVSNILYGPEDFILNTNMLASLVVGILTSASWISLKKHIYLDRRIIFIGVFLCFLMGAMYFIYLFTLWCNPGFNSLKNTIYNALYPSDFLHGMIYLLFCSISWFFCLNGENILEHQLNELVIKSAENVHAWQAGHADINIISNLFFQVWCNIGGSGATLSLALAMLCNKKSKQYNNIIKFAFPLSLLNTNESLLFGVPIVLNGKMIIPFAIVPLSNYIIAYYATYWGIIPPLTVQMSWVTPPLINAWIGSNGSWRVVFLQVFEILLGAGIYHYYFDKMLSICTSLNSLLPNKKLSSIAEFDNSQDMLSIAPSGVSDYISEMKSYFHAQSRIKNLNYRGSFVLFFQPQVELKSNKIVALEALVRHRDAKGRITPPTFLTHFSRLNMMLQFDLFILEMAMNHIRTELSEFKGLAMSVNVSPQSLIHPEFINLVRSILKKPLPEGWGLQFEITESQEITDPATINKVICELKFLGITVALDDFGSGYSSIAYINTYDLDMIKLDRSLVLNLRKDGGEEFLKNVFTLCSGSSARVLIEGIESQKERDFVTSIGISLVQGFYFYKPMPVEMVVDVLYKNNSNPACM